MGGRVRTCPILLHWGSAVDALSLAEGASRSPLVLRTMPQERRGLARSLDERFALAAGVLWELVDAAADDAAAPVGVALTQRGPEDCVTVSVIAASSSGTGAPCPAELVQALVAAFRARAVPALFVRTTDVDMISALKNLGFVALTAGESAYVLTL